MLCRSARRTIASTLAAAALLAVLGAASAAPASTPPPPLSTPSSASAGAAAAGIVELSVSPRSGVVSAWLGNGVRLHHRQMTGVGAMPGSPVASPEPRVIMTFSLAGGEVLETRGTIGLSAAATLAWRAPATRSLGRAEMEALLRDHRIRTAGSASGDAAVLQLECPAAELETGLRVATLLLTEPVVDPAAHETWARLSAERLARPHPEARWLVAGALRDTLLAEAEPRFRSLTPESVTRPSAGDAQAWLDRMIGAPGSNRPTPPMEVSIVGDIAAGAALRLAESALAPLAARERISRGTLALLRDVQHQPAPVAARVQRRTRDARAIAGTGFFGTDGIDLVTHRALALAALVLDERVTVRIRERGWGGISDVLTTAMPGGLSPAEFGLVLPVVAVHPARADDAADLIAGIVAELAATGPTPDEFRRAKAMVSRDVGRVLANPAYWGAVLARSNYCGYTPDDLAAAAEVVGGFTIEDIAAALRAHATPQRQIRLIIDPAPTP